jgi:hypothetical protein
MSTELKPQDGVLIEFLAGPSLDGIEDVLTALGRAAGAEAVSAHREQGGRAVAAYLWGAAVTPPLQSLAAFASGPVEATRLRGIRRLKGVSFGAEPTHHYVVRTDAAPGWDQELQRWYDEEHLGGLASVQGNVLSQRALCLDHAPKYYACYDLLGPDVPDTAAWLEVRGSAWSDRVRPRFTNTRRTMFDDLFRRQL